MGWEEEAAARAKAEAEGKAAEEERKEEERKKDAERRAAAVKNWRDRHHGKHAWYDSPQCRIKASTDEKLASKEEHGKEKQMKHHRANHPDSNDESEDQSWHLNPSHDTIHKSHKFLVMQQTTTTKTAPSLFEKSQHAIINSDDMCVEVCMTRALMPKPTSQTANETLSDWYEATQAFPRVLDLDLSIKGKSLSLWSIKPNSIKHVSSDTVQFVIDCSNVCAQIEHALVIHCWTMPRYVHPD